MPHLQLLTTTPLSNAPSTKSVTLDDDMCHFCYLKSFSTQTRQCLSPSVLSNRLCICFCDNNHNVNKVQGINNCPFPSSIHKSSGLFYSLQRRMIALAISFITSHHNPSVCQFLRRLKTWKRSNQRFILGSNLTSKNFYIWSENGPQNSGTNEIGSRTAENEDFGGLITFIQKCNTIKTPMTMQP